LIDEQVEKIFTSNIYRLRLPKHLHIASYHITSNNTNIDNYHPWKETMMLYKRCNNVATNNLMLKSVFDWVASHVKIECLPFLMVHLSRDYPHNSSLWIDNATF